MKLFELKNKYKTKPIVYVDMDGVLADFFGTVAQEHGVNYWREIHRKELGVDQLAQERGFFKNLPVLPNAGKLMAGVIKMAKHYSILSSPLMSDVDQSSEEKSDWLRRHLYNHQPQAIVFDHEKYKYAQQPNETPNILIDDWDTNIKLWEANGGIGILHKDDRWQQTLAKLRDALDGKITAKKDSLAVHEDDTDAPDLSDRDRLYTNKQVLKYVKGIHKDYHLEKPVLNHKTWVLQDYPLADLKTPEYVHQDDPYRRVIDINWDHVKDITRKDIYSRPVVADHDGWVLDGNHRVTAARAAGLETIPALIPYQHHE
jgi:5'(3')-deoxyribonucleotidase